MTRARSFLLALVASFACASCAPLPQNAEEYRTMIAAHRRGRVERWQVASRPSEVLERLETAFRFCIDREETSCYQGCTTEVHTHVREPNQGSRETISVRTFINGRAPRRAPEDGMFEMMVDVEGSGRRTELTWYGGDHQLFAPYVDAIRRWSEHIEHPVACPDVGNPGFRDLRRATPESSSNSPSPAAPNEPSSGR